MVSLENKVIVITGATSGIGQQCSVLCGKMKAKLILFGKDPDKVNHTSSLLNNNEHLIFRQDIRDSNSFENAIDLAVRRFGAVDGFIHSAGVQCTLPLRLHTKDEYIKQFEINAVAGFEAVRILTKKRYFNEKGGSLIFISSIRGILGSSNLVGYSVSKGGVVAGARSLAVELSPRNIRVNSVSPGMVEDTEMTRDFVKHLPPDVIERSKLEYPLGWINAEDVAQACIFLLSDESKKITGINLVVDGGYSAK